jgi:glyoxylase-like metal-dependent hydrolase (beta-lactamase superfamily II)
VNGERQHALRDFTRLNERGERHPGERRDMHRIETFATAFCLAIVSASADAAGHPPPARTEIGEGIHLFRTPPYGDVGLDGNAVAIVGPQGVLVFDANGTPAAAAAVLAEIRTLTAQPVRYLVLSHWHWDHWYGAEVYADAFPGLQVVAHEASRRMMAGPALAFNEPGLESGLPGYVVSLEKNVAKAKAASPPPAELAKLEQRLETARFFLDQKRNVRHTLANVTYTDGMTVHLGDREVRILNYGRAVTPGDTFLHLPKEKIVVTGDLLVNPISFALSSYPTSWLRALERIDALDASLIVPGHGDVLRDEELLHATIAVFRELLSQGEAAKAKGLDPDQARAEISPRLASLRTRITGGDASLNQAFEVQLVDWFLHRVYEELEGPLGEEIGAIPEK